MAARFMKKKAVLSPLKKTAISASINNKKLKYLKFLEI